MPNFVLHEESRLISNKRVIVTANIILTPRAELSENEVKERISFSQEVARGLSQIEVQNGITGEMYSISVEKLRNSFPSLNWDETYLATQWHIAVDESNEEALTEDEINEERQRHGLGKL